MINPSYPVKNLPSPLRSLLRPMLFGALGLHALLLFTPIPSEEQPKPPKEKEKPVRITQLPTAKPSPKPVPVSKPQVPKVERPNPAPPVVPAPAPTPKVEGSSAKDPGQKDNSVKDPFADFPHYAAAVPGCYDLEVCRESKSTTLTLVSSHFEKALPDKKFDFKLEEDELGKRKVFQVSKGGVSQYITILQDGENTVYVLSPSKVASIQDLAKGVGVPGALFDLIAKIPARDASDPSSTSTAKPDEFNTPNLFYKPSSDPDAVPETIEGIDGAPTVALGQAPLDFYQTFYKAELERIFDRVTPVGDYAGGPLYELKKGKKPIYLNLVPTKGNTGTISVIWLRDPR